MRFFASLAMLPTSVIARKRRRSSRSNLIEIYVVMLISLSQGDNYILIEKAWRLIFMIISIVIPVYNEVDNIKRVIKRIKEVPLIGNIKKEIIIIDDGSTDGTTEVLKEVKKEGTITKIHSSILNFGKGTAIRIGLKYITGDIIIIQDGDLEYDPNDYNQIIQPILENKAKVVYGTRFLTRPKGMRLSNYIANKILALSANILYNAKITDEATAYKAFTKEVINNITLKCKSFEFCPEFTAKVRKKGYNIVEVPISYNARSIAEGKKIGWKDGFVALWTLLKYRIID